MLKIIAKVKQEMGSRKRRARLLFFLSFVKLFDSLK